MLANPLPTHAQIARKDIPDDLPDQPLKGLKIGSVAHQRHLHIDLPSGKSIDTAFPGVVEPVDGSNTPLDSFLESISSLSAQPEGHSAAHGDKSVLRQLLTSSGGALQVRSTPLRTAQDFSAFVHRLGEGAGWIPHQDKGLMVLRYTHAPAVQTANEGPSDQPIGSHNEYGLSTHHPHFIIFFCLSKPETGGETPVASSLEIFQELQRRDKEYIDTLKAQGVTFRIHHPREKIENSLQGNGLFAPDAWGPQDPVVDVSKLTEDQLRQIANENVRALGKEGGWTPGIENDTTQPDWRRKGFTAQWLADGSLLVHQRVPGWKQHPYFDGAPSFFNNIHNRFHYSESQGGLLPPHHSNREQTKNGTPLIQAPPYIADASKPPFEDTTFPENWRLLTNEVTAKVQADIKWEVGDVVIIDNLAVQHARRVWTGPRKLLASLWDIEALRQPS
ncbi:unnamed protein product [Sympodiomycopsis kandeliae]